MPYRSSLSLSVCIALSCLTHQNAHATETAQKKFVYNPTATQALRTLLLKPDSINSKDYQKARPEIRKLVETDKADPNILEPQDATPEQYSTSALRQIILEDDTELAQLCFDHGGNPNQTFAQNRPLAFNIQSLKMAELFDKYDTDWNHKDSSGRSLLHSSAHMNLEVVGFLSNKIKPYLMDKEGEYPLHHLCLFSHQKDLFQKMMPLLWYGAWLDQGKNNPLNHTTNRHTPLEYFSPDQKLRAWATATAVSELRYKRQRDRQAAVAKIISDAIPYHVHNLIDATREVADPDKKIKIPTPPVDQFEKEILGRTSSRFVSQTRQNALDCWDWRKLPSQTISNTISGYVDSEELPWEHYFQYTIQVETEKILKDPAKRAHLISIHRIK